MKPSAELSNSHCEPRRALPISTHAWPPHSGGNNGPPSSPRPHPGPSRFPPPSYQHPSARYPPGNVAAPVPSPPAKAASSGIGSLGAALEAFVRQDELEDEMPTPAGKAKTSIQKNKLFHTSSSLGVGTWGWGRKTTNFFMIRTQLFGYVVKLGLSK